MPCFYLLYVGFRVFRVETNTNPENLLMPLTLIGLAIAGTPKTWSKRFVNS